MLVGAMKRGLKGITEDEVRQLALRVAVGMANIYSGGGVRASLSGESLMDDDYIQSVLDKLRQPALPPND